MTANIALDYQNPNNLDVPPTEKDFSLWATLALKWAAKESNEQSSPERTFDMTVRVVDTEEGCELNNTYRQKNYATNVLSFPFEAPEAIDIDLLGDIVICAPVVSSEAKQQHKPALRHWAHLTIHGTLHLLGFDHIDNDEAELMEAIEINALSELGYPNPYEDISVSSENPYQPQDNRNK